MNWTALTVEEPKVGQYVFLADERFPETFMARWWVEMTPEYREWTFKNFTHWTPIENWPPQKPS